MGSTPIPSIGQIAQLAEHFVNITFSLFSRNLQIKWLSCIVNVYIVLVLRTNNIDGFLSVTYFVDYPQGKREERNLVGILFCVFKEANTVARMNSTKSQGKSLTPDTKTTRNHEGAVVHDLSALENLFSKVLGSFFGESTFYENRNAEKEFVELVETINKVPYEDREYVLKIALLGREHNMIQYPLAVLTACFNDERFKGEDFLDNNGRNKLQYYSDRIIRRGRDIVDVMSTQISAYGFDRVPVTKGKNIVYKRDLPLPIQLRKALKHKLETFNEYQLSKALSESREVSMADCIKLIRPNEKNAKVSEGFFKSVIEGEVKMGAETKQVQSELAKSKNKNSTSTVKDVKESIDTSTVMAIVKNLVALHRAGVFDDRDALKSIVTKLTDKKQIQGSRLLPFRFYSAWKEVSKLPSSYGVRAVTDALVVALDLSINNLPKIEGYNAILIDRSGSMDYPVSSMSTVTAAEIALVLGAICFKQGIGEVYVFANNCVKITKLSSYSTVIDLVEQMKRIQVGGGTYLDIAFRIISTDAEVTKFDNLIMLSDNDCYHSVGGNSFRLGSYHSGSFDDSVNTMIRRGLIKKFYLNNLLGNSFAVVNTDDFRKNLITGFSERIVEVVNIYGSLGKGASDIRKVIDSMMESLH